MNIFGNRLIVLMAAIQVFSDLHSVINRKTEIEQFVVKLTKRPIRFVVSYLLRIEVVGLIGKIVRQQKYSSLPSNFPIS